MEKKFRKMLGGCSKLLEMTVALIILAAVVIDAIDLVRVLINMTQLRDISEHFSDFLGNALAMVIGLEFVRMLNNHSPDLVIEVLIYAIGRHLIIAHADFKGITLGVISICILFAVRRYLLVEGVDVSPENRAPHLPETDE